MKTVARQLVWSDIVPELSRFSAFGQKISDHVAKPMLRSKESLVSMHQCGECRVLVSAGLAGEKRESLQYGFESVAGIATGLISDSGKIFQVFGDLTLVPGEQDCFDVREVLVERGTSDARLFGDL